MDLRGMKQASKQFRMLHNEELYVLCGSHSIVRTVKCQRLQWTEYVASMGVRRKWYIFCGKYLGRL